MNEYLVIDSGEYLCRNTLHALVAALLVASLRSRYGVLLHRYALYKNLPLCMYRADISRAIYQSHLQYSLRRFIIIITFTITISMCIFMSLIRFLEVVNSAKLHTMAIALINKTSHHEIWTVQTSRTLPTVPFVFRGRRSSLVLGSPYRRFGSRNSRPEAAATEVAEIKPAN